MKTKWIIFWNAGYGENYEIVECETEKDAQDAAYDAWREEAESNSAYKAVPYSKALAVDYGIEEEE